MNALMNRVLIQQIISKYPPEVITKLEEAKEPLRSWSIESLRKAIFHYVKYKRMYNLMFLVLTLM